MNKLFSSAPIFPHQALAIIRIIFGLLMVYHGKEIFQPEIMNSYLGWDIFKVPNGKLLAYAGKTSEFIAGISVCLGLFTRFGSLLAMGTLSYITFFIGQGRFWYEDQHPFMFVLVGAIYFFIGPGIWSVDAAIKARKIN